MNFYKKIESVEKCIGLIDGTFIYIARPDDMGLQCVVYNFHKVKHALNFQPIFTSGGLFLHSYGPLEGRRNY